MSRFRALFILDPEYSFLRDEFPTSDVKFLILKIGVPSEEYLSGRILITPHPESYLNDAAIDGFGIVTFQKYSPEVKGALTLLKTLVNARVFHQPEGWIMKISDDGQIEFEELF